MNRNTLLTRARRAYTRYFQEIVVDHGFCPWAEPATRSGSVAIECLAGEETTAQSALAALRTHCSRPATEVVILVCAALPLPLRQFEHFVETMRREHLQDQDTTGSNRFVFAAFHPEPLYQDPVSCSDIDLIRCTPDPTVQAVRESVLQALRRGRNQGTVFVEPSSAMALEMVHKPATPPLSEQIAETNTRTLHRVGRNVLATHLRAIYAQGASATFRPCTATTTAEDT